jgi:bifunctional enzyme CysN/CysC
MLIQEEVTSHDQERQASGSRGEKGVLRFLTCGSVDDGKSTLIGRLLYDCNLIPDDQLGAVEKDSQRFGTTGGVDFALLVDGLQAEREQGITIDVAYRYFATPRRTFIVADTPGHEQYTRNMASGASTSELAVLLADASKGLLPQTRRHSHIVFQLGIEHVVLAVNKMDLVDFLEEKFLNIAAEYLKFAKNLGLSNITVMPVVARDGDNITTLSRRMPWYRGQTLLSFLENVDVCAASKGNSFRFPVQWVNRPNGDFRGFSGTVVSGSLRGGEEVLALPSGRVTRVRNIITNDGELDEAGVGDAITAVLADEIDLSRGDMLVAPSDLPSVADQFAAHLIWMDEDKMMPHRSYLIRCGTQWAAAEITSIKHKISIDTLENISSDTLELNELGACHISTNRPLIFDPYSANRKTGSFILVNRLTNQTAAAGMIMFALRRATNVTWQATDITKIERAQLMQQKPCCLWFTGLPGAGKSTIANLLERRLFAMGRHTYILDGDNVRHGLCRDLSFSDVDRIENIRRAAHAAHLMVDAGLIVLTAFISPFKADRRMARELFGEGEFIEIFVDTPLEVCERRDSKGLYQKALRGIIPNFTGISSPYEAPENAEIHLKNGYTSPDESVEHVIQKLRSLTIL